MPRHFACCGVGEAVGTPWSPVQPTVGTPREPSSSGGAARGGNVPKPSWWHSGCWTRGCCCGWRWSSWTPVPHPPWPSGTGTPCPSVPCPVPTAGPQASKLAVGGDVPSPAALGAHRGVGDAARLGVCRGLRVRLSSSRALPWPQGAAVILLQGPAGPSQLLQLRFVQIVLVIRGRGQSHCSVPVCWCPYWELPSL